MKVKFKSLLDEKGKDHFYIMHLTYGGYCKEWLWNYAKENNIIGMSHRDVFKYDWKKAPEPVKNCLSGIWNKQLDTFCNEMEKDDIVVMLDGWSSILGIAEQLGKYEYKPEFARYDPYNGDFFCYTRRVLEWKKVYNYNEGLKLPNPIAGFNKTITKVEYNGKFWKNFITLEI